jgi:hypothetical protein
VLKTQIKTILLLLGLLGAAGITWAAPCTIGSLQSYTTLGAGGCNIGAVQFTTFSLLPPVFTPINAANVLLTPTASPGFIVGLNATAGPGITLESTFSFIASGAPFASAFVGLSGSSVKADGANTASATFTPGGTAIAFDIGSDSQLTDSMSLNKATSVAVQLDYVIDGGIAGSASLQQGIVGLLVAPEPSSMLLSFSGLAVLAWKGRRRIPILFRRQQ